MCLEIILYLWGNVVGPTCCATVEPTTLNIIKEIVFFSLGLVVGLHIIIIKYILSHLQFFFFTGAIVIGRDDGLSGTSHPVTIQMRFLGFLTNDNGASRLFGDVFYLSEWSGLLHRAALFRCIIILFTHHHRFLRIVKINSISFLIILFIQLLS